MKAEERAREVLTSYGMSPGSYESAGGQHPMILYIAAAIREAVAAENAACTEIARLDMRYYSQLLKTTNQRKWGEAADAAEVIAMNIEARGAREEKTDET